MRLVFHSPGAGRSVEAVCCREVFAGCIFLRVATHVLGPLAARRVNQLVPVCDALFLGGCGPYDLLATADGTQHWRGQIQGDVERRVHRLLFRCVEIDSVGIVKALCGRWSWVAVWTVGRLAQGVWSAGSGWAERMRRLPRFLFLHLTPTLLRRTPTATIHLDLSHFTPRYSQPVLALAGLYRSIGRSRPTFSFIKSSSLSLSTQRLFCATHPSLFRVFDKRFWTK